MKLWKKLTLGLATLGCACLAIGLAFLGWNVPVQEASAAVTGNMLDNGMFDKATTMGTYWKTGWIPDATNQTQTIETEASSTTGAGLKMYTSTSTSNNNQYAYQELTLSVGTYTLSADIKVTDLVCASANNTSGFWLGIYQNGTSNLMSSQIGYLGSKLGASTSTTTGWATFNLQYEVTTAGTYRVNCMFYGATGSCYVDNVFLMKNDTIVNTTISNVNDWTYGWKGSDGSATVAYSTETHNAGTGSLMITNTSTAQNSYAAIYVSLIKDAKYTLSGWIKLGADYQTASTSSLAGAWFSFEYSYKAYSNGIYCNANHADMVAGATEDDPKTISSTSDYLNWQYVSMTFTATQSGLHRLQCNMQSSIGTAYFDEIVLKMTDLVDPEVTKHWSTTASYPTTFSADEFTLLGIGDTQMYANYYPERYTELFQWMADNKSTYNIQYAMHLGDIVDDPTSDTQWALAQNSHALLQNAGLKYSLVAGNHDYDSLWNASNGQLMTRDLVKYNTYFPAATYTSWLGTTNADGDSNFGMQTDGDMANTYHRFEVNGTKYLILALAYGPNAGTVVWAKGIADAYADHHVIVTTHSYLDGNAEWEDSCASSFADGQTAEFLWENLISKCSNIFMVLNGHTVGYGVSTSIMYGDAGNPIIQMKVDGQNILGNGETLIAMYKITNGANGAAPSVQTYYYSVYSGKYYAGSNFEVAPLKGVKGSDSNGAIKLGIGETKTQAQLLGFTSLDEIVPKGTYTSSNASVVQVDATTGDITAVAPGTATLTYVLDGKQSAYATSGVVTKYKVTLEITGTLTPIIKGANLSLEDNIHIQYALVMDGVTEEMAKNVKLLCWTTPQTEYVYGTQSVALDYTKEDTIGGVECYIYEYNKLAMKQMTDVVYARAYLSYNGQEYYSEALRYSILQYAYNKLGLAAGSKTTDARLETLLNDLLQLGESAQIFNGHNLESLPTDKFVYVTVENGTFDDGFNYGLYKPGTTLTIKPNADYLANNTIMQYATIADGVITYTVPEENQNITGVFDYMPYGESPITADAATVNVDTASGTYVGGTTTDSVKGVVTNLNDSYAYVTMKHETLEAYGVGVNLMGATTTWRTTGIAFRYYYSDGATLRLTSLGSSGSTLVYLDIPDNFAKDANGIFVYKWTEVMTMNIVTETEVCTGMRLDMWYTLDGTTYTKVGVKAGEATSGDTWSYDSTTGAFTFAYNVADSLVPDCTMMFFHDLNRNDNNTNFCDWTYSVEVKETAPTSN